MERNAGIEYCRIFSMIYIIIFHFSDYGMVKLSLDLPFDINWIFLSICRLGGGLGNCLFVLISGYLLVYKKFKLYRIIKLWIEVLFYSIILGIILVIIGVDKISFAWLFKTFFPVINNLFWFISTYILLMFCTPYLNYIIFNCTKASIKLFICFGIIAFSIIPTIFNAKFMLGAGHLPIFITLYMIGGYIRIYKDDMKIKIKYLVLVYLVSVFTIYMVYCIDSVFDVNVPLHYFVWHMEKTPIIVCSVMLFIFFKNMKIKINRCILFFSSSTFGVYLIHMRLYKYLFFDLFDDSISYTNGTLPLFIICSSLLIFICGILIDKIRIKYFDYKVMDWINPYIEKIEKKVMILSGD